MATIATTLQALNVQRPPSPARDNVEQQDKNKDDEDDEANQFAAVDDNPFTLSVITVHLHVMMVKKLMMVFTGKQVSKQRYQSFMVIHQLKNYSIG